jgi:hypothetical protein
MSLTDFVTSLQSNLDSSKTNAHIVPGEFSGYIFRCHLWYVLKQAKDASCLVDSANKIINLCAGNASFDTQEAPLFLYVEAGGDPKSDWVIKVIDSDDEAYTVATLSLQKREVTPAVTYFKRMLEVIRVITDTFLHHLWEFQVQVQVQPSTVGSKRVRPDDDDESGGKKKRQRTEDEDEDEEEEEAEEEFEGCFVLDEGTYEILPLLEEL